MFGCTYIPERPSGLGVVICPSLYAESLANYRAEVLLSRQLAERGITVQRFHYRGSGHSDGDSANLTFQSMCNDAAETVEHFRRLPMVGEIAFVGSRWGALIAAACSKAEAAPIALWEPSLDPRRYFREVNRFRLVHEMQKSIPGERTPLEETLRERGTFDILGYTLDRNLYDSALDHTLTRELGDVPRPILLVQMAQKRVLRREYEEFASALLDRGFSVDTVCIEEAPVWWLLRPPIRTLPDLLNATVDWLEKRSVKGRAA